MHRQNLNTQLESPRTGVVSDLDGIPKGLKGQYGNLMVLCSGLLPLGLPQSHGTHTLIVIRFPISSRRGLRQREETC